MKTILQFLLPAAIANMMPVVIAKIPIVKILHRYPVDGGKKLGGARIFGQGKTWGGLLWAVLSGFILGGLLSFTGILAQSTWQETIYFNAAIATGAILGDLLKSFLKRRVGIESGKVWPVFDQLDFIIGAFFFARIVGIEIEWSVLFWSALIVPPLHFFTNVIAYWLKLKKVWW